MKEQRRVAGEREFMTSGKKNSGLEGKQVVATGRWNEKRERVNG